MGTIGIKKLLLESIIVLTIITCLVGVVDSFRIRYDTLQHVAKLQEQYFNATYEIYKDEIIGNILIGNQNIESALLKEISNRRGIGLRLTYKDTDIQTGSFATIQPVKMYELDLGNGNKATLNFYSLNDIKSTLSIKDLGISLLLEILVLSFGFIFLLWRFSKKLLSPLEDLVAHLKPGQIDTYIPPVNSVCEIKELVETMKVMSTTMQKRAVYEAEANTAKQVAHDIRSPLATLNRLLKNLFQFPEQERVLLKNAVQRITDVANNLLAKHQEVVHINSPEVQAELISELLVMLISEKRIQYEDLNIDFILTISPETYCVFAIVNAGKFKQSLSNLIDNAVESTTEKYGKVLISLLRRESKYLEIAIKDNGCGIQENLIENILRGGVTSKKGGHGMGLCKARKLIEEWHGKLSLSSILNVGTKVIITIPQSEAAEWFIDKISIHQDSKIVILDDDRAIHCIWDDRFESQAAAADGAKLCHFYSTNPLIDFYVDHKTEHKSDNLFFLVDYELPHGENGLDLIEQLDIANRSVLVTNKYDCQEVRERAQSLAVKILPKNCAIYVQIETICNNQKYVLLDDDRLVCDLWQFAAKRVGKKITTFQDPESFRKYVQTCRKDITIYIDSRLQPPIKGEVIAKELYDLGYFNLYLASGYPASKFQDVTWVKGIVGKDPPF